MFVAVSVWTKPALVAMVVGLWDGDNVGMGVAVEVFGRASSATEDLVGLSVAVLSGKVTEIARDWLNPGQKKIPAKTSPNTTTNAVKIQNLSGNGFRVDSESESIRISEGRGPPQSSP